MEKDDFDPDVTSTVGFEFKTMKARVGKSDIELKIWDAAGQ